MSFLIHPLLWVAVAIVLATHLASGRDSVGKTLQGMFIGAVTFFAFYWLLPLLLPGLGDKVFLLASLTIGVLITGMVGWS